MPIEVGIWRLDGEKKVEKVASFPMPLESKLEDILTDDISILDPKLMLVGRQVPTDFGKFVDLLAIDPDGKLVVIELKKDRTPREVIAQILDYGSWVRKLQSQDIAAIFSNFTKKYKPKLSGKSLDEAFCEAFRLKEMPEDLNEAHELCVIASELDNSTERIVTYLADEYGVGINVVFFRFYKEDGREYLSRVWLIDPGTVEAQTVEKRGEEPWNGEYYVSFGEDDHRHWDDARKYGFVSAGGGDWYSKTLDMLEPGTRIWVNVPGRGYVGAGHVKEKAKPQTTFAVQVDNKVVPVAQALPYAIRNTKDEDQMEYFVAVDWIKTEDLDQAVREKGFFGNQNSAARPKTKKWNYTIDRLKKRWGIN